MGGDVQTGCFSHPKDAVDRPRPQLCGMRRRSRLVSGASPCLLAGRRPHRHRQHGPVVQSVPPPSPRPRLGGCSNPQRQVCAATTVFRWPKITAGQDINRTTRSKQTPTGLRTGEYRGEIGKQTPARVLTFPWTLVHIDYQLPVDPTGRKLKSSPRPEQSKRRNLQPLPSVEISRITTEWRWRGRDPTGNQSHPHFARY